MERRHSPQRRLSPGRSFSASPRRDSRHEWLAETRAGKTSLPTLSPRARASRTSSRSRTRTAARARNYRELSSSGTREQVGWRGAGNDRRIQPLVWWGFGLSLVLVIVREMLATVFGWLWLLIHGGNVDGGGGSCAFGYSLSLGPAGQLVCQPTAATSFISSFFWAICVCAMGTACLFTLTRNENSRRVVASSEEVNSGSQDSTAQILRCVNTAVVTRSRDLPLPTPSDGGQGRGSVDDFGIKAETIGTVFPQQVVWARQVSPCAISGRLRALINYPHPDYGKYLEMAERYADDYDFYVGSNQWRHREAVNPWGWVSLVSIEGERLFQPYHPQDVTVSLNGRLSPSRARTIAFDMDADTTARRERSVIEGSLAPEKRIARIDPDYEELCITVGTIYDPGGASVNSNRFQPLTLGATPVDFGPGTDAWLQLPLPLPLVSTDPFGAEPFDSATDVLRNHREVKGCVAVVHRLGKTNCLNAVRTCQRSGALAVLIINYSERPHRVTTADDVTSNFYSEGVTIPAITVRRTDGELLWARLDDCEVLLEDVAYTAEASNLLDKLCRSDPGLDSFSGMRPGVISRRLSFQGTSSQLRKTRSLPYWRDDRGSDASLVHDHRGVAYSDNDGVGRRGRRRSSRSPRSHDVGSVPPSSVRLSPSKSSPLQRTGLQEGHYSDASPRQRQRRRRSPLRSPPRGRGPGGLATPVQTYTPAFMRQS